MKSDTQRRRGQPLIFLATIFLGWLAFRMLTWESPWPVIRGIPDGNLLQIGEADSPIGAGEGADSFDRPGRAVAKLPKPGSIAGRRIGQVPSLRLPDAKTGLSTVMAPGETIAYLPIEGGAAGPEKAEKQKTVEVPTSAASEAVRNAREPKRWRFDSWLFLRDGSPDIGSSGNRPASYGGSQAGAIVSYRLFPDSLFQPSAYLRGSAGLSDGGERELAGGVSGRPLADIPITVHAELRATRQAGTTEIRPAGFVTGGFDREPVGRGLEASAYTQAGYVGGTFATPFVDGKLTVDRQFGKAPRGRVRLGGGVWGGAQKGASRLDIGPSATFDVKLNDLPFRASLDYRVRIAGNAEPGNGPALTLSTGF